MSLRGTPAKVRLVLLAVAVFFGVCLVVPLSAMPREKVIFDTDIGTDVDDSFALAYLLAEPRCELLGITTCFTAPECRAEMVSAICTAFGRTDIPIHPGRGGTLVYPRAPMPPDQLEALGNLPRQTYGADGSAVDFMRRTIRANPGKVTLIAVGPFMNVAELLLADPEAAKLLKRLVVMGGRFFSEKPLPEWNCMCDPEASALVFGSGAYARIPATYFHGLDVTAKTALPPDKVIALCSEIPALTCIRGVVEDFFRRRPQYAGCGKAMHDPLACASVFYPELCRYRRGRVLVASADCGATTRFAEDAAGKHFAADTVDVDAFYRIYKETLINVSDKHEASRGCRAGAGVDIGGG